MAWEWVCLASEALWKVEHYYDIKNQYEDDCHCLYLKPHCRVRTYCLFCLQPVVRPFLTFPCHTTNMPKESKLRLSPPEVGFASALSPATLSRTAVDVTLLQVQCIIICFFPHLRLAEVPSASHLQTEYGWRFRCRRAEDSRDVSPSRSWRLRHSFVFSISSPRSRLASSHATVSCMEVRDKGETNREMQA